MRSPSGRRSPSSPQRVRSAAELRQYAKPSWATRDYALLGEMRGEVDWAGVARSSDQATDDAAVSSLEATRIRARQLQVLTPLQQHGGREPTRAERTDSWRLELGYPSARSDGHELL